MPTPTRTLHDRERQNRPQMPEFGKREPLFSHIADRLAGRRAVIAIDNTDFLSMGRLVSELIGDSSRAISWSHLLQALPELHSDILLIMSPRELLCSIRELEGGLIAFRRNNPKAFVVLNSLHNPATEAGMEAEGLRQAGLLDHLEEGFAFFPHLMEACLDRVESKEAHREA